MKKFYKLKYSPHYMKYEFVEPRDLIPIDGPWKPKVVESLRKAYAGGNTERIPPVLVRHVKGHGIFVADGGHRTGVAHIYRKSVLAIFLNSHNDIADIFALADMGMFD